MRISRAPVLTIAAAAAGAALVLFVARPAVPAPPGAVGGKVTVIADGSPKDDASNVVVYLEGIPADVQPLPTTPQVHQHDQRFTPDVTVVTKGSTIAFPNDDRIFHNVFSVSEPARFDLGLYKSGESKSVQFERPGVVDVYCNIHPQMAAKVKVLDTPYYALTAANGSFFIPNVPPGTYPVVAWQPYGAEYRGTVTVASGGTATVSMQLTEGEKSRHHLRKDGQPYGRYK